MRMGATAFNRIAAADGDISIHAPHAGRDFLAQQPVAR